LTIHTADASKVTGIPVKLSKTPGAVELPPPTLGQHTEEVLLEYGYTWEDIEKFKGEGIIA
jgi:crotonobetainyl-CoA:carnitine CoA-transferase CaiB-like acyl-CoA transferase